MEEDWQRGWIISNPGIHHLMGQTANANKSSGPQLRSLARDWAQKLSIAELPKILSITTLPDCVLFKLAMVQLRSLIAS